MVKVNDEILNWIQKNHPRKLSPYDDPSIVVEIIMNWLTPDSYSENGLKLEDPVVQEKFRLLDEYFSKVEFFPVLKYTLQKDQYQLIKKFKYYSILISLCESDPGKFKYIYNKKKSLLWIQGSEMMKCKFQVLQDGSIDDLTHKRKFENYEEMKKHIIMNDTYEFVSDPKDETFFETKHLLTQKAKTSRIISDYQIIHYFLYDSTPLVLVDGKITFSLHTMGVWSNVLSDMMFDEERRDGQYDIHLITTRKIFVLYVLYRLTNFLQNSLSINILKVLSEKIPDFPDFDEPFGTSLIVKNIIEIYKFCDYLEDSSALPNLLDIFRENVSDKYEIQKFYDLIFHYPL